MMCSSCSMQEEVIWNLKFSLLRSSVVAEASSIAWNSAHFGSRLFSSSS